MFRDRMWTEHQQVRSNCEKASKFTGILISHGGCLDSAGWCFSVLPQSFVSDLLAPYTAQPCYLKIRKFY
jgi:hypothetical protein